MVALVLSVKRLLWLFLLLAGCSLQPSPVPSSVPATPASEDVKAATPIGSGTASATGTVSGQQAEAATPATEAPVMEALPAAPLTPEALASSTLPVPLEPTSTLRAEMIYQDTFTAGDGWFTREGEDFSFAYHDGRYLISVLQLNTSVWSTREGAIGDVLLEVEARREEGSEHGLFGLICRFIDARNYYALLMDDTGRAVIHRYENGSLKVLARSEPVPAGALPTATVPPPGQENVWRLQASCTDSTLSLSVDGRHLVSAHDEAYLIGEVGLAMATGLDGDLVVAFDNFKVFRP